MTSATVEDAISLLDEMNEQGRIEYADYSQLHDIIAATPGRGTCKNTQHDADFMCSVCGKCVDNGRILGFNYCPNCGCKVVDA